MFGSVFDKVVEKIVLFSVILFPLLIVLVKSGGTTVFGLTAILSLVVFFTRAIKLKFSREEKLFFYSCLVFFLMSILVSYIGGIDKRAWTSIGRILNLLLAIPLYFLFKMYLKTINAVWYGLFFAVVMCGLAAIYEMNFGSYYHSKEFMVGRAKGATHPILFADMTLSMTTMLLIAMTTIKEWNRKLALIAIVTTGFGVLAVILSQSRGAWVIMPVLFLMILWQCRTRISIKLMSASLISLSILIVALYLIPATGLQKRLDTTFNNVQKYSEGTNKGSSIGSRFEMWQAALVIFKDNPIVGVGWGDYKEEAKKLVDAKKFHPAAASWNNPHNQYLSVMASGGLMLSVALLMFIFIPMYLFRRSLLIDDSHIKSCALAGIILIVAYMGYALSESIFERSIPTTFYAFYLALFFALVNQRKETILSEANDI